ncbi:MAG: hypothetical protein M3251_02025 [Thermoproteota archaeon]|nr:hypothetical protein [Thermoproteota archaeon]
MTNNSNSKKVAVFGGIAIALAIAALVLPVQLREISAQVTNSTVPNPMQTEIPQLNGSVNIQEQSNQFIQQSVQVPFATALETAQAQVGNGTAISGHLGVVQGYLVYIFKLANFDAETSRIVIVDAGNGSVLHTSGDMPLYFGGLGCGGGGIGGSGGGHHSHKGFGSHWGNNDRGSGETSSADINSSQPGRNPVVVSPAIGI